MKTALNMLGEPIREFITIYALCETAPPDEVRYIGKSVKPVARIRAHKRVGIAWARSQEPEPIYMFIERVPLAQGDERERFWIDHYNISNDLVNTKDKSSPAAQKRKHKQKTKAGVWKKSTGQDMKTVSETTRLLGVSRQSVMQWIADGRFPGATKGNLRTSPWLIPVADIEAVRWQLISELRQRLATLQELPIMKPGIDPTPEI